MRLVENEKAAGSKRAQPVAQRARISLVNQKTMGNQKPSMSGPRVDAKPALLANLLKIISVEDLKGETKSVLKLLAPLQEHRWRTRDDYLSHFLTQQEFPSNQPCLDGFAKTYVIRYEQIDSG